LERWSAEAGSSEPSYYNFAVTDGASVAAVRYVSDATIEPASLYYSTGGKYECSSDGVCKFCEGPACERTIIIASERLTTDPKDWVRVAPNHLLTITPDLTMNVELIDIARIDLRGNRQDPHTSPQPALAAAPSY